MKTNYITEKDEMKLENISTELFKMYSRNKSNDECIDFYERLAECWQIIDKILNDQYIMKRAL